MKKESLKANVQEKKPSGIMPTYEKSLLSLAGGCILVMSTAACSIIGGTIALHSSVYEENTRTEIERVCGKEEILEKAHTYARHSQKRETLKEDPQFRPCAESLDRMIDYRDKGRWAGGALGFIGTAGLLGYCAFSRKKEEDQPENR